MTINLNKLLMFFVYLIVLISCKSSQGLLPFIERVNLKEEKTSVEINVKSLKNLSIWVQDSTGTGVYIQFKNGEPSIFSQEKDGNTNGYVITFDNGRLNGVSQYYTGKYPTDYPKECRNDSIPYRVNVPYGKFIYFVKDSLYQEDFGWGEILERYYCK
jgi:hypothetical protein